MLSETSTIELHIVWNFKDVYLDFYASKLMYRLPKEASITQSSSWILILLLQYVRLRLRLTGLLTLNPSTLCVLNPISAGGVFRTPSNFPAFRDPLKVKNNEMFHADFSYLSIYKQNIQEKSNFFGGVPPLRPLKK